MTNYKKMSNQWYEWRYGDKELKEETINEAPEHQLAAELNKVSDNIIKIANKYKKKADVDGMVRSWMLGLKSRLKKSGIKAESTDEGFADKFAKNVSKYNKRAQKSRDTLKKYAKVKKK